MYAFAAEASCSIAGVSMNGAVSWSSGHAAAVFIVF